MQQLDVKEKAKFSKFVNNDLEIIFKQQTNLKIYGSGVKLSFTRGPH